MYGVYLQTVCSFVFAQKMKINDFSYFKIISFWSYLMWKDEKEKGNGEDSQRNS